MIHDNWYHDVAVILEKYVDERIELKIKEIFGYIPVKSTPGENAVKDINLSISDDLHEVLEDKAKQSEVPLDTVMCYFLHQVIHTTSEECKYIREFDKQQKIDNLLRKAANVSGLEQDVADITNYIL